MPPIPREAHILSHSVNLTLEPKSGFKNKCRTWIVILRSGFNIKLVYNSAAARSRNSNERIYQ